MNRIIVLGVIFTAFFGTATLANAQEIPSWVKTNAGFWADGSIDDATFVNALQFLIGEGIIVIPETKAAESQSSEIPSWIKGNAAFWAQDSITDSDFIGGIQYLIANGIITIESESSITLTGNFVDGDFFHRTSGLATIEISNEKANLYFDDDFRTVSGPDLYVYLATDKHANDYVDLGMIKQFGGVQSYEIPNDVDFEKYSEVVIWCKSFGVLFGNAHLEQ